MGVIFLLCVAFALSVATADPVKETKPEPMEESVPVQQNKTGEEKRGGLLHRIAGRMTKWQVEGNTPTPYYYSEDGCPFDWRRHGSRYFIFISSPMAWIDAEKHCLSCGANLASIHDQWEYDFIRDSVMMDDRYYGRAWIGGSDAVRTMDWLWSDGSAFDVESWAKIKPSSWSRWKECLTISWSEYPILNNWYCEEKLPFVCGTRPSGLL